MAGNINIIEDEGAAQEEDEILYIFKDDDAKKLSFFFNKEMNDEVESLQFRLASKGQPEINLLGKPSEKATAEHIIAKWKCWIYEKLKSEIIQGETEETFQKVENAVRLTGNSQKVLPLQTTSNLNNVALYSKDLSAINTVKNAYNNPDTCVKNASVRLDPDLKKRSHNGKNESVESEAFKLFDHNKMIDNVTKIEYCIETHEGLQVILYQKPITRLGVDAIVNAANERLANVGGVADVISRAAGPKLERECRDIISKQRKIEDGGNVVTSAGNLPYRAVIHAVGPRWHEYKNKNRCLGALRDTVINILETARNERFKSVAMPPISSGIFAVPKSMCAAMYLKGILEFSEQGNLGSLREFHIIDIQSDVLDFVKIWHKKYLNNPKCLDIDSVLSKVTDADKQDHGKWRSSEYEASRDMLASEYSGYSKDETRFDHDGSLRAQFQAPHSKVINSYCGKTDIHIYTKDILTLRNIDTIVVSESGSFKGEGNLSNTLLRFGCEKYKKEYHEHQKRWPWEYFDYKQTKVITTSGGTKLPFKHVLHAIIRRQPGQQEEHFQKQLQETLKNVLEKANAFNIRTKTCVSIALPLIGLGKHMEDEIVWECSTSFENSIKKFLRTSKKVYIKEIHLVNNNDFITNILQIAFNCKQDSQARTLTRRLRSARPDDRDNYGSSKNLMKVATWRMEIEAKMSVDPSKYMMSYKKKPKQSGNVKILGDDDFAEQDEVTCVICLCDVHDPVELVECHHVFCRECIMEVFGNKPSCPVCGNVYGEVYGDQPRCGWADIYVDDEALPGYRGKKTYVIHYEFPAGKQESFHPEPGKPYEGIKRRAFLPYNKEGTEVLNLLRQAFEQGLTFTIGTSRTTGKEGVITWNDIHHKTSRSGGPQKFGYPDSEYLMRVKEELACKGVVSKP